MSPGLRKMTARAAAAVPFAAAARLISELAGITLTGRRAGRRAEADGKAAAAVIEARSAAVAARRVILLPGGELLAKLYIAIDGTGVPMVAAETEGRDGKGEDGKARTREVKMAVAFTQATVDDEGFPVRDPCLLQLPGHLRSRCRVRDLDGRRGLPARRRARPPAHHPGRRRRVDLEPRQHSTSPPPPRSSISTTPASTCTSSGRSSVVQMLGTSYDWPGSTQRLADLDHGDVPAILAAARALPLASSQGLATGTRPCTTSKRTPTACTTPGTATHGLFIGSGAVEAGCKSVVGQRLKLSGMRWTEHGATGILTLRCHEASNRWDEIWPPARDHTKAA